MDPCFLIAVLVGLSQSCLYAIRAPHSMVTGPGTDQCLRFIAPCLLIAVRAALGQSRQ
jgi:hypothetical protein